MNQLFKTVLLSLIIGLQSCQMFESHPYDTHFKGERDVNAHNISKIEEKMKGKRTMRFAFMSDTQRWYDETKDMVADINRRGDIDFVVHGGDFTDFGATHEFTMQRDIINRLQMPWVGILGNHDCLGTGELVFDRMFGNPNFYFVAGNVLFLNLNTNAMEYDYSRPVPDLGFLENLIKELKDNNNQLHGQTVEKTVAVMHVPPFGDIFNNNVANVFQLYLQEFPQLTFCMNGHVHSYAENDIFGDGIIYYQTPCAKKRGYMVFTINEDGYEHELVEY